MLIGVALFSGYLMGGIPFGLIFGRLIGGVDPRMAGSGNIGFTNVLRVANRLAAVLTLVCDVGKGMAAVWIMLRLAGGDSIAQFGGAIAAMIGHMYSPYLRLQGGKGVATALGGLSAVHLPAAVVTLSILITTVWLSSYVSLGSLIAFGLLPAVLGWLTKSWAMAGLACLMAVLILLRHRENITRLRAGKESSVFRQKSPS